MPRQFKLPWRRTTDLLAIFRLAFGVRPASALFGIAAIARGKRQRGWNQLSALAAQHPNYYETWIRRAELAIINRDLAIRPPSAPLQPLCFVLDSEQRPDRSQMTIASLRQAFGSDAEIWVDHGIFEGCSVLDQTVDMPLAEQLAAVLASDRLPSSNVRWAMALRAGDLVSPYTGLVLGDAISSQPSMAPIFWDEDCLIDDRRCDPWLKGAFDEWLNLGRDSLSGACLIPIDVLAATLQRSTFKAKGGRGMAELILSGIANSVMASATHIPFILTHRREGIGFVDAAEWADLVEKVWRKPLRISINPQSPAFLSIAPAPTGHWPFVSIIIPTKDRASLLAACLASLAHLEYPGQVEIIIVDNGSTEPDALALIEEVKGQRHVRVIRQDGPFNFSALNNFAVKYAEGQVLCLMNNDVTAIDGTWLESMVLHVLDPQVGAVGARLLYPSGEVQHAGVVIGIGGAAGHVAKGVDHDEKANSEWHSVTRTVSAVTAACLVVSRDHYLSIGGLDEEKFPVAFNDVDFCLRLQASGLVNRFVAEAQLYHHESISRGDDRAPENRARFARELENFKNRWCSSDYLDPWYSPLLSRSSEACTLQF